jgi:hypothetical protein
VKFLWSYGFESSINHLINFSHGTSNWLAKNLLCFQTSAMEIERVRKQSSLSISWNSSYRCVGTQWGPRPAGDCGNAQKGQSDWPWLTSEDLLFGFVKWDFTHASKPICEPVYTLSWPGIQHILLINSPRTKNSSSLVMEGF